MTDTSDTAVFDFDHARILALYADGRSAAEIGVEYCRGVAWVYQQMAQFPERKDEAKLRRQEIRTGKKRRIGAVSDNIIIKTLDTWFDLLNHEDALQEELAGICEIAVREDWTEIKDAFAEAVKEAIKTDNPRPSPPPEIMEIWQQEARQQQIEAKLGEITFIKSKLKDISLVGAAAEKQADLDDGKPTERVDNQGVQIVVFETETNSKESTS